MIKNSPPTVHKQHLVAMKGFVLVFIFLIGSHSIIAFIPFFLLGKLFFVLLAYLFFFTKLRLIQTKRPQNMLKV